MNKQLWAMVTSNGPWPELNRVITFPTESLSCFGSLTFARG